MDAAEIIAEVKRTAERLATTPVVDQKREFLANCYPLMLLIAEGAFAQSQRLDELEQAFAAFVAQEESVLMPELAARIQATCMLAARLCDSIEEYAAQLKEAAEGAGEKIEGSVLPLELLQLLIATRDSAFETSSQVERVTAEFVDEEDDSDDDEQDEETSAEQEEDENADDSNG